MSGIVALILEIKPNISIKEIYNLTKQEFDNDHLKILDIENLLKTVRSN